jgi:hypothetical protein
MPKGLAAACPGDRRPWHVPARHATPLPSLHDEDLRRLLSDDVCLLHQAFVCAFTGMREDVLPNYSEVYADEYGDIQLNMLAAINTANTGILVHWRSDDQTPFELVK